jgi:hypothetical protein
MSAELLCPESGKPCERKGWCHRGYCANGGAQGATLRDVLLRNGFVECDTAACNCGSWHARYGYPERFREFDEALSEAGFDANGSTTLARLKELIAQYTALQARPPHAKSEVPPSPDGAEA